MIRTDSQHSCIAGNNVKVTLLPSQLSTYSVITAVELSFAFVFHFV